ncbi:hypothetical protein QFZ62_000016 [Clavibacter sp. B3I6]|nr:hypothetical protein [Clavibacter sp. B3I6]
MNEIDHRLDGLVEVDLRGVDGGHTICGVHEIDDLRVGPIPGGE